MKPNFELVTELQTLQRRDFPLVDPTLLQPYNASAIVDGEWLKLNAYKLERGSNDAAGELLALQFPVHTEKGRYDVQAIQKASVLFLGMYEAETAIYQGNPAVGSMLVVQTIAAGTFAGKRGLGVSASAAGVKVTSVGIVTRAAANGRLRFVHFGNMPAVL